MLWKHNNNFFPYNTSLWIGRTKKKPIYVIQTFKRPVPLEHHLFLMGNIYKVVDASGQFLHANYGGALQAIKEKSKAKKQFKSGVSKSRSEVSEWAQLIDTLNKKKLLPVVVFSFSISTQHTD